MIASMHSQLSFMHVGVKIQGTTCGKARSSVAAIVIHTWSEGPWPSTAITFGETLKPRIME